MIIPPSASRISSTHASLAIAKANKEGKESFKGISLHHTSCQNLTLLPLPISNLILDLKVPHTFLIDFRNLTSWPSLPSRRHQPPSYSSNFPKNCSPNLSLSKVNLQHHFPQKALLIVDKSLIPRPCLFLSLQITN